MIQGVRSRVWGSVCTYEPIDDASDKDSGSVRGGGGSPLRGL